MKGNKVKVYLLVLPIFFILSNIFLIPETRAVASSTVVFDDGGTPALLEEITPVAIETKSEIEKSYEDFSIYLDKETIAKGYTVGAFEDTLKLSLVPGILDQDTRVDCEEIVDEMPIPWNLEKISKIYQFEFRNKEAYDNHKPFYIQFSYDKKTNDYKRVFFYDKNYGTWRELPTVDYPEEQFVRSLIHLPYARIVVLSDSERMSAGRASWYAYKGGNFAASPDFPKGSRLRVYNMTNSKYVDITVNDYGPDRSLFPDRVIDLDKIAFSKIASLGAGIIDVKIEALYVVPDNQGRVLGIYEKGAVNQPEIQGAAGIVINEETGEVLLEKNPEDVLPLASLSKLVAIKTFLDTMPTLSQHVSYLEQDELYNYEYCNPWESAKLKVVEGDILTIENLLYSALVGSANNAVETLVRVSGLEREDFITKMNENVKKWGAENTSFEEPTGLSPQNVTTASDYAIITKEVFKNSIIQKASVVPRYEFTTINTKKLHRLHNTNTFIKSSFWANANNLKVTGSKTGYLNEALYCLMARATGPSGEKVIVISLGEENKDTSFENVKELIKYGIKAID